MPVAVGTPHPPGPQISATGRCGVQLACWGGDVLQPGLGHSPRPLAPGTLEKGHGAGTQGGGTSREGGKGPRTPHKARPSSPTQKAEGLEGGPGRPGAGGPASLSTCGSVLVPARCGDRDRGAVGRPRRVPLRWALARGDPSSGGDTAPEAASPARLPSRERAATRLLSLLPQADVRGHRDGRALTPPAASTPRPRRPRGSPLYRQPAPRHRYK